ncbi:2-aminoethanethiol dioxygenase [Cimex lectularius]|uniref:2-aminoethanethiol dioxygenase n=1 Tax=Cimex lectularius TaxID=79782 RepID=A0A8I6RNL5_CIMLE|nr:2-aminoethanethiol dioxygenase [Cimex lectularius]
MRLNPLDEKMMRVVRNQAMKTFKSQIGFEENLKKLVSEMNKLTSNDVKFDTKLLEKSSENSAPVTFIGIEENEYFSMSMFVLKDGSRLPLHDHPMMHGLCKVILGKIHIKNYSFIGDPLASHDKEEVLVQKEDDKFVTPVDETVLLTPNKGNIHELSAEQGPAVFLDILAPPYFTNIPGVGARKCHYYKRTLENGKSSNALQETLVKLKSPPGYWTDEAPYLGTL